MTTQQITWDDVREAINEHAAQHGEWAGAPLPIHGLRLTVEPRYPWQGLQDAGFDLEEEKEDADDYVIRNSWYSHGKRCEVYVMQESDCRITHVCISHNWPEQRMNFIVKTLGACGAWDAEAEIVAMGKLRELVGQHKFNQYLLTGTFLETSKRSQVTYLFRRLRPTLAIRPNQQGTMSTLAALCLHPIGYYQETFAGVMVPTDCVIAHLMLMRGDEHLYWRKANQHSLDTAEAGV